MIVNTASPVETFWLSCQNFVKKRQGKDGKFQTLEEDIPLEIREKIKNLKS
jgi:hypothetical protein